MANTVAIPHPHRLPIVGNLPDISINAPVQSLMRLAKAHGPIFRLTLGSTTITVLCSQELANEVCDESRFCKKVHRPLQMIRDLAGDGLFTAYNDEPNWAKAHRLLMPAFGPAGIRGMFDKMEEIAEQMLLRWERFGPEAVIDVAEDMTRLTLDTIALCAFGYRFNSFYQNERHPFVTAMVSALDETGLRTVLPDVASRLLLCNRRRYEANIALMNRVGDTLITERRRDPSAVSRQDLLHLMLEGRDPETGEKLSDENIRYQMVTFLIAGHETTSGMLSFAIYLLMRNPEVLQRARAIVDDVLGSGRPRVEDMARLRYIEQILQETLRLWPTAPAFAVEPYEPTTLAGRYSVTPEDTLLVLVPALHRDPRAWGGDVEAFRPERFEPKAAATQPPNSWKPFGNGARSCIGRGFAMQEAQLVLSMILQRMELTDVDPTYRLEIAETLTLKPNGFRVHARLRSDIAIHTRSAVPSMPQHAPRPAPASTTLGAQTPLLVLYGSNAGSCKRFAEYITEEATTQGYTATAAPMDDYVGRLPAEGMLIVVTASYEGQPPGNARRFVAWAEGLGSNALEGVRYCVFGCGDRQWGGTYQSIPKRMDIALERAGATRVKNRGETDASGDFFGGFEEWKVHLWMALGKETLEPAPSAFDVEIVRAGRERALRFADLDYGRVVENRELVNMNLPLARSKRHIEIALPAGMTYRSGDYLAVLPRNPRRDVERALRRFDLVANSEIIIRHGADKGTALPSGYPVMASDVLTNYVELAQPATMTQVAQLAAATRCPPDRQKLETLSQPADHHAEVLAKRVSLLDLLERFPACEFGLGAFLAALPPMRARQYSISSSPLHDPTRCSLTVAVLDVPALSGARRHLGVASTYLAGLEKGASVSVAVRPSQTAFHPPRDPRMPIIMVCAGSGIAPFRGFLQERAIQKAGGREVGPALLFFGVNHADADYLYKDELAEWQRRGLVEVFPAFSEAPDGEITFVQHRVWQHREAVAKFFRRGASVFVCGDGERMASAVRATFVRIYQETAGASFEQAEAWAEKVERETGRYVADVFG